MTRERSRNETAPLRVDVSVPVPPLCVDVEALRHQKMELIFRARHGDIKEPAFFFDLLAGSNWMGRWAPLVNVSLFSIYHFWSPWQVLGRMLGLAPMVYAVRWKENIYLGMVVHCSLNTLGIVLIGSQVLGRL